jgi:hypothetical protein
VDLNIWTDCHRRPGALGPSGIQKLSQAFPLKRLILEAIAIVGSILLAFAIDAWWQQRNELKHADALIVSLHADFETSQVHLAQWLAGNQWMHRSSTELLENIKNAATDEEISVRHETIVGSIGAATYDPTSSTLDAMLSSGQINLIEDVHLRNAIAMWQQKLADTQEDEDLVRQIGIRELIPALAEQVRLGRAFEFDRLHATFINPASAESTEQVQIRATTRLEGALGSRVFYSTYIVNGLAEIYDMQENILEMLESQIELQAR